MKYTFLIALMVCTSLCQASIRPADGLWSTFDDPANGSGLMLTTQNGITLVSLFTYDATGQNTWYTAAGRVNEEDVFESNLRKTQNGSNILSQNPTSAELLDSVKTIKIKFNGTQLGTMSIDDSVQKVINAQHFGFDASNRFPGISGQWLLASQTTGLSYILDLVEKEYPTGVQPPVAIIDYLSTHPSTSNWEIGCVAPVTDQQCFFNTNGSDDAGILVVEEQNIGSQRMTLNSVGGNIEYQAFRLNDDRRLLPNDGHWRSSDDPDVGSGIAMRTQGEYTVILLYSYDAEGAPQWQIASGQFDVNGKLVSTLLTPNNGSAIESTEPFSATFETTSQVLEIQMHGTELATFSIGGSEPKYIQNYNFGAELFKTTIYQPMNQPFFFQTKSANGSWWMRTERFHQSGNYSQRILMFAKALLTLFTLIR